MTILSPSVFFVTLDVNVPNALIKRQRSALWNMT